MGLTTARLSPNFTEPRRISSARNRSTSMPTSTLAACVTSTLIYHAAARGIVIEEVESKVEGDIDLRGFLGTDKSVRNGFQNIRMSFDISADVNDEELQELAKLGPTFSPVLDSLTKGVPVTVQAQRMRKK